MRRVRTTIAAAVAVALAFAGLTLGAVAPASAVDGTVSGTVFRDFDQNGVRDSGDQGLGGVTVTAYDSDGAVGSDVSAADGTYAIAVVGSDTQVVRVEFTGLPAGYEHGAVSQTGADTGTSVRFIDLAAGTDVDFSVNAPEDHSQENPPLITGIQWAGSADAGVGTKLDEPALVGLGFDDGYPAAPQPPGFPNRVTLATFGEVGATSSNVYQASSNSLFTAATYKRQSGLGPLGLGGIYRVTDVLGASGDASGAGVVEQWLDLESIGIDLGPWQSNAARGLAGHQAPVRDPDAFANAAKVGVGDMALSPDGNTLYFVNLWDKRLYAIDVSDPSDPPGPGEYQSYDLGLGVGERPWALTVYRGEIYVGYVDTGETAVGPQPGIAAANAGLQAHVIKAPLGALGGAWTGVLDVDLGYTKGRIWSTTLEPQSRRWNTWTDTWTWTGGAVAESGGGWQIYPQPVLSDLYVDEDGFLSLGFTDRTSIQGGNRSVASDPAVPGTNFEAGASGDTLIAGPNGDGTFTLESNGIVGSGADQRVTTSTIVNQGPGGREFYRDSHNLSSGTAHEETTLGYLAGLRGTGQVISTVYDPLSGIRLPGITWMSVDDGSSVAGYELTTDGGPTGAGGNFQKGGGLGGISLLLEEAPVEVGNRVWFDADHDGIQDPQEPAIAGVTVNLIRGGAIVGTAVTDADGAYYFSSDPDSDFYVASGEFVPNGGEYTIEFVKPATGNLFDDDPTYGTVPWSDVDFTLEEAASSEIGSNPDPTTGRYTFTVGGPGENDHSFDAGFFFDVEPAVDIEKGDGTGTAITHDADTMADGEAYDPGETRTIVFRVTNSGTEPLREVRLTDESLSGGEVEGLVWTFPDGSTANAVEVGGVLTATWEATFDPGTTTSWAPGEVIAGTATLTVTADDEPHVDTATVSGVGLVSDIPVDDADSYNAFTGDIQVIKYDGERPDPDVDEAGDWIVPTKPLVDPGQDANTPEQGVAYPAGEAQSVRWVVTNTGTTWLTNITLADVTNDGPAVGSNWSADLSRFGGPSDYSFVVDGPWEGLLPPGASFFAEGSLTLAAGQRHSDTVTVTGLVVVPDVDDVTGLPNGDPSLDPDDDPIVALRDGEPFEVGDDDPFHAQVGPAMAVTGSAIVGGVSLVALLLLLAGAGLLLAKRSRRGRHLAIEAA